ncbi:MAG: helix-turn-helix domain-containing protein [Paludibacteraceae bacterium]
MLYHILSILPVFVCLFWFILLVAGTKENNNSKRFLTIFMFICIINYSIHALYFNHYYQLYAMLESIWVFTSLSVYPLYYYYIRLLTIDVKYNWKWFWTLLPSLLIATFTAIIYLLMSPLEVQSFVLGKVYNMQKYMPDGSLMIKLQMWRMAIFKVLFAIQVFITVFFGIKLILNYNIEIRKYYSNVDKKDLSPIIRLLWLFVFTSLASLLVSFLGKDYFIYHPTLLMLPSGIFSTLLFGIGYLGYKQEFTIQQFAKDISDYSLKKKLLKNKKNKTDDKTGYKDTREQLFRLFEYDEIFKNPELRITDVAFILGTNRTYVSRAINEETHSNFCEWVNEFRVKYAKKILADTETGDLPLSRIAEMSGFSSESSFYRVFKEKENISPGNYRKRLETRS